MKLSPILPAAAAMLLCTAAAERPVLRPTRDVDVTYTLDAGGGPPLHERLRWAAATQRLRVDPPAPGLYVIIDFSARRMSTVRLAERTVIEMAAPDNVSGMPDSAATTAVRQNTDTVAGLACTDWDMTDAAGGVARVCLTDDGVLLRARSDGRTLLSAESVHYGPLDAALFQVPPDYTRRRLAPQAASAPPGSHPSDSPQ